MYSVQQRMKDKFNLNSTTTKNKSCTLQLNFYRTSFLYDITRYVINRLFFTDNKNKQPKNAEHNYSLEMQYGF